MNEEEKKNRCKGRTKAGKPCRAAATDGGLCFLHANPNKASELGRIGGRSKRPVTVESSDPLPILDSAVAVRDLLARLIQDLLAGRRPSRVAVGLAPLLNLQFRVIEAVELQRTAEIERRLAQIEKQLAEGKRAAASDAEPDVPSPGSGEIVDPRSL